MSNAALWHYLIWFIVIHVWSLHHPACQPRNLSASDVSKERRDIKHNYNGFLTPEVDSEPQSWVDLCISHTITRIFHLWGVMHQKSIQQTSSTCLSLVQRGSAGKKVQWQTQRIQGDRQSITDYNDSKSLLTPRNRKSVGCSCLSLCGCSSSLADRHRRRDRPALHSWAEFNCGLWFDWNSLLKLPPLHSVTLPRSLSAQKRSAAKGLSSSFDGQTHFSIMHTREGN